MMKKILLSILYFFLLLPAISCTIGVATGNATSNGRPLLWKTRDIASFPDNMLGWEEGNLYDFLYVRDYRDSLAWMGMNSAGFSIVNSYVQRQVERPIFNNGSLIYHLLGNCATISDMDAILDSLNISDQVLSGNFAAIDSLGNAAMYEISWTEVIKYDASEIENGYIIRTNFSLISGGEDGIERYQRSVNIIEELISNDQLDAEHLRINHMRDFSDDVSGQVTVPFEGRWLNDRPWGYIKSNVSIARGIAASCVIMEGVINEEPAITTTMYALLGHPATSVFTPFWAIDNPPLQVTGSASSPVTDAANLLKDIVFDYAENSYYLDSYNLLDPNDERLWDVLIPFEAQMQTAVDDFLPLWRDGSLSDDNAQLLSEEWASRALTLLDSAATYLTDQVVADFNVQNNTGGFPLTVNFEDRSLHNPTTRYWDFQDDDFYDLMESTNPDYTYEDEGTYSVKLFVSNNTSESEIVLEDIITVTTVVEDNQIIYKPTIITCKPNPLYIRSGDRNTTEVEFYLPQNEKKLAMEIYNHKGQKVYRESLPDTLQAGINRWIWDGVNSKGSYVASGVYLFNLLVSEKSSATGRITVIR